jgi:hypothetical protein
MTDYDYFETSPYEGGFEQEYYYGEEFPFAEGDEDIPFGEDIDFTGYEPDEGEYGDEGPADKEYEDKGERAAFERTSVAGICQPGTSPGDILTRDIRTNQIFTARLALSSPIYSSFNEEQRTEACESISNLDMDIDLLNANALAATSLYLIVRKYKKLSPLQFLQNSDNLNDPVYGVDPLDFIRYVRMFEKRI